MQELQPSYPLIEGFANQRPQIVHRFEAVDVLDHQQCSLLAPDSPEVGGKGKRDSNHSDFDEFMVDD